MAVIYGSFGAKNPENNDPLARLSAQHNADVIRMAARKLTEQELDTRFYFAADQSVLARFDMGQISREEAEGKLSQEAMILAGERTMRQLLKDLKRARKALQSRQPPSISP